MAITGVFPGVGLTGGGVTGNVYLSLVPATAGVLGGIKPGVGCLIKPDGTLDVVQGGVTSITTGVGLGAPVSGDTITSVGTIKLLPPSADGTKIGGVKAGQNVRIQVDGEITVEGLLQTNNPYAYNSYIWPATTTPVPAAPGENGQVLTLKNKVTGEIGWASTGSVSGVTGGTGISVTTTAGVATVSLASGTLTPATVGATGLIPTFAVNQYGHITSYGLANPYSPFQIASSSVPAAQRHFVPRPGAGWEDLLTRLAAAAGFELTEEDIPDFPKVNIPVNRYLIGLFPDRIKDRVWFRFIFNVTVKEAKVICNEYKFDTRWFDKIDVDANAHASLISFDLYSDGFENPCAEIIMKKEVPPTMPEFEPIAEHLKEKIMGAHGSVLKDLRVSHFKVPLTPEGWDSGLVKMYLIGSTIEGYKAIPT